MTEVPFFDGRESSDPILETAFAALKKAHAQQLRHHSTTSEGLSLQRMESQIPELTSRLLKQHNRQMVRRILRHGELSSYTEEQNAQALEVAGKIRRKKTAAVFAEGWHDSILSTPNHPIHAKGYGRFLFNAAVRRIVSQPRQHADALGCIGWISLDGNAMKSFIDCTTSENATHYLQKTAELLTDKKGSTRHLVETELGINVTSLAAGGDEFALLLIGHKPLSPAIVTEIAALCQAEISANTDLQSFLNFDDPSVLMNYGMEPDQRKEFKHLDEQTQREKLSAIRATLPDAFIPSFSASGAVLDEAIRIACKKGTLRHEDPSSTFDNMRDIAFETLRDLAEARQKQNKVNSKASLAKTDPRQYQFTIRTNESRRLDTKLQEAEEHIRQLEITMAAQAKHYEDLLRQVGE